jgi:hypothetical protein
MSPWMPPSHSASVRELLEAALLLFRATLLKCLPLGMLAVLCAQLPNLYWRAEGHPISLTPPDDPTYVVLTLAGLAPALLLIGTMMLRQRAVAMGAPLALASELATVLRRLPVLYLTALLAMLSVVLLAALLASFSMVLGICALIVPGLFLLVCDMVLMPVVLFEQAGPVTALLRCIRLVRPIWWKSCATFVFAVLFLGVCALVLAAALSLIEGVLLVNGPVLDAIAESTSIALGAMLWCFLSVLALVLHSAASSSA